MSVFYPLYYHIYRINLTDVFALIPAVTVFVAAVRLCIKQRFKLLRSIFLVGTLFFFLAVILYFTVFKRTPQTGCTVILNPLRALEEAGRRPEIFRALTMNILLFFPFGICFSCLLSERWSVCLRLILTMIAGLVLSLTVETLQYLRVCGNAEMADVISNTVGVVLGSLHLILTALIRRSFSPASKE